MDFTLLNKSVLLVGKRNSGKSQLLRYLVSLSKSHFKTCFLISPTEKINSFYAGVIKEENIFDEYKEAWVETLMKKMAEINKDKNEHTASHVLLVLDDLIADLNFAKSKTIKQLLVRGRHLFISIIITSQYLNSISPLIRSNMDFIAVSQLNAQGLSLLIDNFHMGDISKDQFKKLYFKSTTNYGFFLINTSCCQNNDIDEIYGQISTPKEYIK